LRHLASLLLEVVHLFAGLPLEVVLLRELEIGGVNSKEGLSLGVEGSDADLGVDVEETLLSARRPDSALNGEGVSAEVVVVEEALEGKGGGGLVMGAKVSVGCNRAGNGYS
jgi:hypothetical protein